MLAGLTPGTAAPSGIKRSQLRPVGCLTTAPCRWDASQFHVVRRPDARSVVPETSVPVAPAPGDDVDQYVASRFRAVMVCGAGDAVRKCDVSVVRCKTSLCSLEYCPTRLLFVRSVPGAWAPATWVCLVQNRHRRIHVCHLPPLCCSELG